MDDQQTLLNRIDAQERRIRELEEAGASRESHASNLSHSLQKYRLLFDSIDEGFCIIEMLFDANGKPCDYVFREVNAAFERQTGLKHAVGRRMRSLAPKHEEYWFETYGEIALTGKSRRFENPAAELNHYYDVYAFRIGEPEERKVAVLFKDISERKRTEQALRAANLELTAAGRQKDEFLAMLAHELRNPLAAISNVVKFMEMRGADQPPGGDDLAILSRQTETLSALVDDLLDVARVTRGQIELRRNIVDLGAIASAAVSSVYQLAEERDQALSVNLPGAPLWVDGDAVRLEQIIVNLLTNAVKYTEDGGSIRVGLGRERGQVTLRVSDSGIGLAPDMLGKVFELFIQGERGGARPESGLGIGLTIVKRLVELHGGSIRADSEGPGRGSTFEVRLPAAAAAPQADADRRLDAGAASRRILVVDDNRDVAVTMAHLLGGMGHEVAVAHDGPEALTRAGEFLPDIVLLDIGMPGMSGLEVASELRGMACMAVARLAALTGYDKPRDRELTRQAGFDAHFVKPVNLDELAAFIRES